MTYIFIFLLLLIRRFPTRRLHLQTNCGYLFIEGVFTGEGDFDECECIVVHVDRLLLIGVLIHGDDYP